MFRLVTAVGAASGVAAFVYLGDGSTSVRVVGSMILLFAAAQWLFIGALARAFGTRRSEIMASKSMDGTKLREDES